MSAYQDRVNAEWLGRQAPDVQRTAKEILVELHRIGHCLYWALDPEEKDGGQWASSIIEHAHALLDMGHEYRAALKANPPRQEDDE